MTQYTIVRVVYDVSGRFTLGWCISTVLLSSITLGLYLPIAINSLARYLCDSIEIQISRSEVGTEMEASAEPGVAYESFEWKP